MFIATSLTIENKLEAECIPLPIDWINCELSTQ